MFHHGQSSSTFSESFPKYGSTSTHLNSIDPSSTTNIPVSAPTGPIETLQTMLGSDVLTGVLQVKGIGNSLISLLTPVQINTPLSLLELQHQLAYIKMNANTVFTLSQTQLDTMIRITDSFANTLRGFTIYPSTVNFLLFAISSFSVLFAYRKLLESTAKVRFPARPFGPISHVDYVNDLRTRKLFLRSFTRLAIPSVFAYTVLVGIIKPTLKINIGFDSSILQSLSLLLTNKVKKTNKNVDNNTINNNTNSNNNNNPTPNGHDPF